MCNDLEERGKYVSKWATIGVKACRTNCLILIPYGAKVKLNVCNVAFPVVFDLPLCIFIMLRSSNTFWYRLFSMSKNPKKSFQRFTVSANSQCICAFGADKNCVVGETTCIVWVWVHFCTV